MTTVAIVQARMGSTRFPGKVLAEIGGAPALAVELGRLARASLDEVVVATTASPADDAVVELARSCGVRIVRGSGLDVLDRYVKAAREVRADIVVRVTGDCPLLDPEVVDRVVAALDADADYSSNVLVRTFPVGLDAEAISREALERVHRLASTDEAREHVTWFVRAEQPDGFVRRSVEDPVDNSDLRWTLDTAADLSRLRRLAHELDLVRTPRPYAEVVAEIRARPDLAT